jgi:hypothetical protein
MNTIGHGDIYLARSLSESWQGPWQSLGPILTHAAVPFHNQHDDPTYEWGLEGSHIAALPDGRFLLTAVCFLKGNSAGRRQRLFAATANHIEGPYQVHGILMEPTLDGWMSGENGHGYMCAHNGQLHLAFQARQPNGRWHVGLQPFDPAALNRSAALAPAQPNGMPLQPFRSSADSPLC